MKEKIKMYFDPKIVEDFTKLEQNEKNFNVADIVDQVIVKTIGNIQNNFKACELGGGAHPDRYHRFFGELIKNNGTIDRVDVSPYMLELAKKYIDNEEYKDRLNVIKFIENDIISYLESTPDNSIDLAIMKYTIDHISDIDELFELLQKKLKKGGTLVSSVGVLSPNLKSISTNARFLYNGEEFPENETKTLKDGDNFTVKFFKVSGKPELGYTPGAETTKYYHSKEKYEATAKKYGLEIFIGDRKDLITENKNKTDQDILTLKKFTK